MNDEQALQAIAAALADTPPFRVVLGKVTIIDATETRPHDTIVIEIHSNAIREVNRRISEAIGRPKRFLNYIPHLRVADVQPGTADKWIGWDGLEGESVIVDSLTFVNRNHEAHKIPLQGAEGEYVLEEPYTSDQEGIEQPIDKQADQYVASGYRSRAVKDDPRQLRMLVPPPEPIGSTKVATFRDWGHAEEQEHPRQAGGLWGKKFVDTSSEHPLPMFDPLKHQHAAALFRDESGNPRQPDPATILSVLGKSPVSMIAARRILSELGMDEGEAENAAKSIFWNPQHAGYDQAVMPQQLAERIHQHHQEWRKAKDTPVEQGSYCATPPSVETAAPEEIQLPQDPVDIEPDGYTQDGTPERYTMTAAEIAEAVKSWKEPSKAQIKAENYTKPTIAWKGLTIKIETPKGKKRNPAWPDMPAHYGYFSRVGDQASEEARDGDKPDVFIAGNPESDLVVVIDQETPGGRFDEWKVIIGCNSEKEAIDLYRSAYTSGWRVGPATSMTTKQFKAWLSEMPDKGRIAEQVSKYALDDDSSLSEFEKDIAFITDRYGLTDDERSELIDRYCAADEPNPSSFEADLQQVASELELSPGETDALRKQYEEAVTNGS